MMSVLVGRGEVEAAERALIGAWLMDGTRVGVVLARLGVRREWWSQNRTLEAVAGVCIELMGENEMVDALLVADRLRRCKEGEGLGEGVIGELEGCIDACPTAAHAEYYAAILRREYLGRQIRRGFMELASRLDVAEPELVAAEAGELMRGLLEDNEVVRDFDVGAVLEEQVGAWRQAVEDRMAGKAADVGVPLPWWRLTKLVGGLPQDLVVLAARPSVGKTALEGQIRVHAAGLGYRTLSMLMDMGAERVLPRDVCRMAGVSMPKLKFGFAREDQLAAVAAAGRVLAGMPMEYVVRTTRLEVFKMRARAAAARGRLDLITADHCQLFTYAGSERHDMRGIVTRVTAELKALAQELRVPVLLLSQLRRCEQGQQEREPELDDLRDSGSLEQDAAVVMFLHRDMKQARTWQKEGDEEGARDKKRPVKLLVKKNQDGGLGTVRLLMRPHYFSFELADESYVPMADDDPKKEKGEG